MAHIRLEIDSLAIHLPKRRWHLYFVVAAEHPSDRDKLLVAIIPGQPILVVPGQNNVVDFEDAGPGANGLYVLSREMPASRELNVHIHIMHSRRTVNDLARVLQDIEKGVAGDALGVVSDILGTTNSWLIVARKALPVVGKILEKIPDRNLGFVSAFERFGPEFEGVTEVDRVVRGGHVTLGYSWSVE